MSRVPQTKSRLEELRARKKAPDEVVFNAAPGTRLLAAAFCALLAAMFAIHQTQIEGDKILIRLLSLVLTVFFAGLAFYFFRRGRRRGPVLRITRDGLGIALGFSSWLEFRWDEVEAFRYWEPTGLLFIIKRRQSRWVGVLLNHKLPAGDLPWDVRFEIWLNTIHNRPGFCVLHPFVDAPILDVLQAFKDHAPKALDDYEWMKR